MKKVMVVGGEGLGSGSHLGDDVGDRGLVEGTEGWTQWEEEYDENLSFWELNWKMHWLN